MCENIKEYKDYLENEILIRQPINPELEELFRNMIHLTASYGYGKINYEYDATVIAVRAIANICTLIHKEYDNYILPLDVSYCRTQNKFEITWITRDFNINLSVRDSPYYPNIDFYMSNGVHKKSTCFNDPDDIDFL